MRPLLNQAHLLIPLIITTILIVISHMQFEGLNFLP